MNRAVLAGFNFGLISGIITTLGLMVGLRSSTNSQFVVIGGIITIAIADALSDAMGMHFAVESQNQHSRKEIWEATVSTFVYKFLFSSLFIIPVLFLQLQKAILMSILIGLYLIFANSLVLARKQNVSPIPVILEHVALTVTVVIVAHYLGLGIALVFS